MPKVKKAKTPPSYRPNPLRQVMWVVIAIVALAGGYFGGTNLGKLPFFGEEETVKVQTFKASEDVVRAIDPYHAVYEESLPGDVYMPPAPPPAPTSEEPTIDAIVEEKAAPSSIAELVEKVEKEEAEPVWQKFAAVDPTATLPKRRLPRIAVVIDDVGVDQKRSERMVDMPSPLTLSFLPYARNLPALTGRASRSGHELMVHVSMEPKSTEVDPGPNALLVGLDEKAIRSRLDWALSQFEGFVGINNHMGSKFTEDSAGMAVVMGELKSRQLLFLDSRTTNASVGARLATQAGVPHIERNVFLDHANTAEAIRKQIKNLEAVAKKHGWAVGIGHPREATLKVIGEWLPTLKKRGFELVPLSTLVKQRMQIAKQG